jgi:hypothetical protein
MIYILIPYEGITGLRVFTNFGLMEQLMLRHGAHLLRRNLDPDWCTVFGYDSGVSVDEYTPIWRWYLGDAGQLIRERFSR